METREIQQAIEQALPGAEVYLEGEGCDFFAIVISAGFIDLSAVKRQQQVLAAVAGWLAGHRRAARLQRQGLHTGGMGDPAECR